jgi:hypothetical protein
MRAVHGLTGAEAERLTKVITGVIANLSAHKRHKPHLNRGASTAGRPFQRQSRATALRHEEQRARRPRDRSCQAEAALRPGGGSRRCAAVPAKHVALERPS